MFKKKIESDFQSIFGELVQENLLIEYEHKLSYFKEDSYISFIITAVNGCRGEYQYKKKYQGIVRDSLFKLRDFIQTMPFEQRVDFLYYIRDELSSLLIIVEDNTEIFEENEYGPKEEHHFKSFVSPTFKGTKDENIKTYEKSIKRKAEGFTLIWLDVISEAIHKVDFLINQIDLITEIKQIQPIDWNYVNPNRIKELKEITSTNFDLTRLIQLCSEINDASLKGNPYSVILLVRALIDHIPPIFEKKNFQEVANNYGSKSFKESIDRLDKSSRKIADSGLHQQIRKKEVLPNNTQVNFSNDLDVLLGEIVRVLK